MKADKLTFKLIEIELSVIMSKQRSTPAGDHVESIYSQMFSVHKKFLLPLFTSAKTVGFLDIEGRLQRNDKAHQLPAEKKCRFWSWRK